MRVLVNALSIGSLSGQHVLFGHLAQLATWTQNDHEFVVVHQAGESEQMRVALPMENIEFVEAPIVAARWTTRSVWEWSAIPRLMRKLAVERYFTPSGMILPKSPVPQFCLAQNPWCLVPAIHRTAAEHLKARLQRVAYRRAVRSADHMIYNSKHIRSLYLRNAANIEPGNHQVVFQGIDDHTHRLASEQRDKFPRRPLSILSVSAMAHWKGAETTVRALAMLRQRGIKATLDLVGPWPDAAYERFIRKEIQQRGLSDAVTITGKVSLEALHQYYASSQVYCLMSRCESFGIPAIEAQAFGTPVVGSNSCATAEISGEGGLYGPPQDASHTADLLQSLLIDQKEWNLRSQQAITNAARFRWSECSRPLLSMFGESQPALSSSQRSAFGCN